jgi:hypothetical protein
MKRVILRRGLAVLAFAFFHAQVGYATIVNVHNADFEQLGNAGTLSGIVGTVTQQLGSGPWSASSSGVIGLLGPTLTVDPGGIGGIDGAATISGLASINVIQLIANSGEFFQVLTGVSLLPSTPYRLSADVRTGSTISLSSLSNSGIGIGVGTALIPGFFKSTTAPLGAVTLVSAGTSGRLSFEFTTPSIVPAGDIRIRLYGGDLEGVSSISIIPGVTFDSVLLEIVPEPSSAALLLFGCLGLARRRH